MQFFPALPFLEPFLYFSQPARLILFAVVPVPRIAAAFPDVKALDPASGTFDFVAYTSPIGPTDPIWHHGERLAQLLDLQREGVAAKLDREGQQRKTMVEELMVSMFVPRSMLSCAVLRFDFIIELVWLERLQCSL